CASTGTSTAASSCATTRSGWHPGLTRCSATSDPTPSRRTWITASPPAARWTSGSSPTRPASSTVRASNEGGARLRYVGIAGHLEVRSYLDLWWDLLAGSDVHRRPALVREAALRAALAARPARQYTGPKPQPGALAEARRGVPILM